MSKTLNLQLDRASKTSLAEQIRRGITAAIDGGVLAPGARLPSWLDLAAQLGVARGTVKTAYERLVDEQLITASRSGGTRVAHRPAKRARPEPSAGTDLLPALYQDVLSGPAIFQNGVPAPDCFPVALFARLRAQAARAEVVAPAIYPDPRGELELKSEIAAHLALARGIECRPSQIFVAAGFSGALGVTLRVLRPEGQTAWVENPGFPPSRRALEIAQISPVPIPVDEDGLDVSYGLKHAPDAAVALVTPGQQAPLGGTLSLARRIELIEWATRTSAWIIEDDYLGELQLKRRAAPSLASLDSAGRVIHIGSFSKTISPTLRLGFVVVPAALVAQYSEAVACLAPAPGPAVQLATAEFIRDGHYMRHLRRMKRVYAGRSDALRAQLEAKGLSAHPAGLAQLLPLPDGARDDVIAREAFAHGLAPSPLSTWFSPGGNQRSGLILGVATAVEDQLPAACDRLHQLIRKFS
ncbi:MocR-like pyridoxine biosynthesis transcription factor PdxR [Anaeromyxobacter paludicola]|uniref:Transcriptional regulator n=1 Tax=Anaeromyxobacter paludicola TaxID=2918171 RepID=A0ABM7XFV3_9BACT|nr:PLP-dependent aminotransferase family protein [Anaeromyxobacter paludicola]BDG10782.1 transcriptional regulator [Anaeromyxobacter paludicola]